LKLGGPIAEQPARSGISGSATLTLGIRRATPTMRGGLFLRKAIVSVFLPPNPEAEMQMSKLTEKETRRDCKEDEGGGPDGPDSYAKRKDPGPSLRNGFDAFGEIE
jgi:hypothetical protein